MAKDRIQRNIKRRNEICPKCQRPRHPKSTTGREAAAHREMFLAAGFDRADVMAFAYCRSTVLLSQQAHHLACECDHANWQSAFAEYERDGADVCWARLGVTDALMQEAKERRVAQLLLERGRETNESQDLN